MKQTLCKTKRCYKRYVQHVLPNINVLGNKFAEVCNYMESFQKEWGTLRSVWVIHFINKEFYSDLLPRS